VVVAGYEALNVVLGYPESGAGDAIVSAGHAVWLPLALFGLIGLYLRQGKSTGRGGAVGFALAALGTLVLGSIHVSDLVLGPVIEQEAPQIFDEPSTTMLIAIVAAGAAFAVGHVLFAVATLRAGVLPRPAAVLYLVGAVLGLASVVGLPLTTVVLHAGLAWLGLAVLAEQPAADREGQMQVA
jgi:hypothetical protein